MKKAILKSLSLLLVIGLLMVSVCAVELTKEMITGMSPDELMAATGLSGEELKVEMDKLLGGEAPVPPEATEGEAPTGEAPAAAVEFTDAKSVKNADAVAKLVGMGVIDGFEDGSFRPEENITREAMAKMVAVAVASLDGETIPEKAVSKFDDVADRWSAKYVDYCADKGIINGRSESVFDYASTITVTETAKLLLAYIGFTGLTGDNWATTTYNAASLVGLLDGVDSTNTEPITRDEAALVICTAIDLAGDESVAEIIKNFKGGLGGGMTGGQGGSGMPAPPPGGGGMVSFSFSDTVTALESKTYDNITFADSTNGPENAVQAKDEVKAVLNNPTVTKSAGDAGGDGSSFYGTNAGIMAGDTATIEINGGTVTTSARGANGVFAYGKSTITVKDLVVRTSMGGSGGIMAAGGGTLYATNCDVETQNGSSAAIRSDRGGGTMVIDGGRYVSHGGGSPAIYVTANITAKNCTLTSTMAQGVVIEGKNSVTIENCELTGDVGAEGTTASDDDEKSNIMVMQSMSGDAAIGTAKFTMSGGKLIAKSGNMFYTTNTSSEITISGVEMTYANDIFLICACNENMRHWGTPGSNGAKCIFTATKQEMKGQIQYDTASTLDFKISDGSSLEGDFVCRDWYTGEGGATVTVDKTSSMTVVSQSAIGTLVIEEGAKVNASKMTVGGVETPIAAGTYTDVVLYK